MSDGAPKSAYELAMERLLKKDAEEGVEHHPPTEAQKAAIAEIRNFYQAKLAEIDLLHQHKLVTALDPAELELLNQEYRRDRERLTDERDRKIEKARN
jgi:hypothetical protein